MKSDDNPTPQRPSKVFDLFLDFTFEQTLHPLYCKLKKLSRHVCINKNCTQYAFICQDDKCKCKDDHKRCVMAKTQTLINSITGRIVSIDPLKEAINYTIDTCIDKLSDFRDKLLIQINKQFGFCGLNSDQINVLESIKLGDVQNIKGFDIYKANMGEEFGEQLERDIQEYAQNIKKTLEKLELITQPILKQIWSFNQVSIQHLQNNRQIMIPQKITKSLQAIILESIFMNSTIIKKLQDIGTLLYWFQPKKILTTSLLYRASQNDFCTKKFHTNCDHIRNTLTLCQTTTGKVIGGYSALNWQIYRPEYSMQNDSPAAFCVDQTQQSFMFSLTHKDKFLLKQDKKSILWWKKEHKVGPSFGSAYDLVICDQANLNFSSYINLNGSYFNQSYNLGNEKIDNQRFIGKSKENTTGKDNHFSSKDWEVWSIQFC